MPVNYSFDELYDTVKEMCKHKMDSQLYKKLTDLMETHVKNNLKPFLDEDMDQMVFLKNLDVFWGEYCQKMVLIQRIFSYLDRTYAPQNSSVKLIRDMGSELFCINIASNSLVQRRTVEGVLGLIEKERNGHAVDRVLLKNLLCMFCDLEIYHTAFHDKFFLATKRFYKAEGERKIQEMEIYDYLQHATEIIVEENMRLLHYFDSESYTSYFKQLINIITNELLVKYSHSALKKGFKDMLNRNSIDGLTLLYNLFIRCDIGTLGLCKSFTEYIKRKGRRIVIFPRQGQNMIQNLLNFKDELDKIVYVCFDQNEKFIDSLRKAFEFFINLRAKKSAELLAKYVDMKLSADNKDATNEGLDKILDKIMMLFQFIHDKDVFKAFYKTDLAKRLLVGKSASVGAEKSMLSKLKQESGGGFILKCENMLNDIIISNNINEEFNAYISNNPNELTSINFHAYVLNQKFWLTNPVIEYEIPPKLLDSQNKFNAFYSSGQTKRELMWQSNLGSVILKVEFNKGPKELEASEFQAIVILLFNNTNCLKFDEIKSATKIEDGELRRTLQSLTYGKCMILTKHPKRRKINDDDEFHFNSDFTSKKSKVQLHRNQMKKTLQDYKATEKKEERRYIIETVILEVMKINRKLGHKLLKKKLDHQVNFTVKPADFKKCLETLISKGFIQRNENNKFQYT